MGVRDYAEDAWIWYKSRSKGFLIVSSLVLFLFSLFFIIAGGYLGATYTSPTEQGAAIAAGISGALLLLLSLLGAAAIRSRSKLLPAAHL